MVRPAIAVELTISNYSCRLSTEPRARHPKPDVERVLRTAEAAGRTVTPTSAGHRWGVAACPSDCQPISIWSTPKNPGNHAKDITRRVERCPHPRIDEEENP